MYILGRLSNSSNGAVSWYGILYWRRLVHIGIWRWIVNSICRHVLLLRYDITLIHSICVLGSDNISRIWMTFTVIWNGIVTRRWIVNSIWMQVLLLRQDIILIHPIRFLGCDNISRVWMTSIVTWNGVYCNDPALY